MLLIAAIETEFALRRPQEYRQAAIDAQLAIARFADS
jgi:hypothetical protein